MNGPPTATLTLADPGFPRRLARAREASPRLPGRLEVRGEWVEPAHAVAIVGARAAAAADLSLAEALATAAVGAGAVVVSGGALGIDAAAHCAALAAGGRTVAVLGTGLDVTYPARHRGLFDAIARSGALVSSLPRAAPPRAWHFVARNAVIAALVDLVVVVGASARSGSLHTAEAAARLGRRVGAAPGAPGCERLLAAGALLVDGPEALRRCLRGEGAPRRVEPPPAGSEASRLLAVLSPTSPTEVEELAASAGVPLRAAQAALADLEIRGLAALVSGQAYVRAAVTA